jgi:hypothetical protein
MDSAEKKAEAANKTSLGDLERVVGDVPVAVELGEQALPTLSR